MWNMYSKSGIPLNMLNIYLCQLLQGELMSNALCVYSAFVPFLGKLFEYIKLKSEDCCCL